MSQPKPLWKVLAVAAGGIGALIGVGAIAAHRDSKRSGLGRSNLDLDGPEEDEEMAEQSLSGEEQAIEDYGEREEAVVS